MALTVPLHESTPSIGSICLSAGVITHLYGPHCLSAVVIAYYSLHCPSSAVTASLGQLQSCGSVTILWGCVDIMSTSALSRDSLVSILMSTLQCIQVVGITLSSPCVYVCPPWQILRLGLLYFIVSVDMKAGKIVSRGNRTQDHRYAEHARRPLGHTNSVGLIIVRAWITVHACISLHACAPANLT